MTLFFGIFLLVFFVFNIYKCRCVCFCVCGGEVEVVLILSYAVSVSFFGGLCR